MKVSKDQSARNRRKVLVTAAKLYRERGFEGASVNDIMRQAGFTHGGFYGHFDSKEDLIAQACQQVIEENLDSWKKRSGEAKENPLAEIAKSYLSEAHCNHRDGGCLFAALSNDLSRQAKPVRTVATQGLRRFFDFLESLVPGKADQTRRRRDQAITTYAGMIGGIVMARAVNDPELAREILAAVSRNTESDLLSHGH